MNVKYLPFAAIMCDLWLLLRTRYQSDLEFTLWDTHGILWDLYCEQILKMEVVFYFKIFVYTSKAFNME